MLQVFRKRVHAYNVKSLRHIGTDWCCWDWKRTRAPKIVVYVPNNGTLPVVCERERESERESGERRKPR